MYGCFNNVSPFSRDLAHLVCSAISKYLELRPGFPTVQRKMGVDAAVFEIIDSPNSHCICTSTYLRLILYVVIYISLHILFFTCFLSFFQHWSRYDLFFVIYLLSAITALHLHVALEFSTCLFIDHLKVLSFLLILIDLTNNRDDFQIILLSFTDTIDYST